MWLEEVMGVVVVHRSEERRERGRERLNWVREANK